MIKSKFVLYLIAEKVIATAEGESFYDISGTKLDATVLAAIIAAVAALITLFVNFYMSIRRNNIDGIVSYRMKWINELREEFSKVLGWQCCAQDEKGKIISNPIDNLRISAYKINLMLNICDKHDKEISDKLFEYLDAATNSYASYCCGGLVKDELQQKVFAANFTSEFNRSEEIKKELQELVRIYLKVEWMRVRAESSIRKKPYNAFWIRGKGFQSDKAFEYYKTQYEKYETPM